MFKAKFYRMNDIVILREEQKKHWTQVVLKSKLKLYHIQFRTDKNINYELLSTEIQEKCYHEILLLEALLTLLRFMGQSVVLFKYIFQTFPMNVLCETATYIVLCGPNNTSGPI